MDQKILGGIYGLIVGDVLGVSYEFSSREEIKDMGIFLHGYGSWQVPEGTWSDDSSLALCLVDSLCNGYDLVDMSQKMIAWKNSEIWVATGRRFDIGNQTSYAIDMLSEIINSEDYDCLSFLRNEADEFSNGNGSLMKILPLLWYIRGYNIERQFEIIWEVSALTHPHIISAISCFIYLKFAEYLLLGYEKYDSYKKAINDFLILKDVYPGLKTQKYEDFSRILSGNIGKYNFSDLISSGFVIHSLEVALWSFLNANNFQDSIEKSISFGGDTDTAAAICGGIAGLYYGYDNIPKEWREVVLKKEEILELLERFSQKYEM